MKCLIFNFQFNIAPPLILLASVLFINNININIGNYAEAAQILPAGVAMPVVAGTVAGGRIKKNFLYDVRQYEVPVDHFDFANNETFQMRYLYNDTFVEKNGLSTAPILFYTGNEGDIELFAQNTGFMWELAQKLQARIVFAEHRYYGQSLPFGANTFNSSAQHLGYLSVEQTLEDFAALIDALTMGNRVPVIAFGGSYGGMLSAWIRMKYPHLVTGALAASAPVWQFNGLVPCDIYYRILNSVYTTSLNPNCSANIKSSWEVLKGLAASEDGRKQLNTQFKFCQPLVAADDINKFFDYLEDVYSNLAMANYPYDNDFLAPLPAYPVRQFCYTLQELHKGNDLLDAMQKALSVYSNFTGKVDCLNMNAYDPTLGGDAWEIQTCNQMVMPMCSSSKTTMFRDKEWNFKEYQENCWNKYKIKPKLNDIVFRYGGKDLRDVSNIIFSNGLLDPWSGGGVLQTFTDKITVIIIPEGAHHLDLRSANKADPPAVIDARRMETQIIKRWIRDFQKQHRRN